MSSIDTTQILPVDKMGTIGYGAYVEAHNSLSNLFKSR